MLHGLLRPSDRVGRIEGIFEMPVLLSDHDYGLTISGRPKIRAFFGMHGSCDLLCEGALDILEAHCLAVSQHLAAVSSIVTNPTISTEKVSESVKINAKETTEAVIAFMRGLEARQESRMAEGAVLARGEIADRLLMLIGSVDNAVRTALVNVDASAVSERVGDVVRQGVGAMRSELMEEMRRLDRGQADSNATLAYLKKGSEEVQSRVERLQETVVVAQVRHATNQCVKGKAGENRLMDLLGERLTSRDNFQVDLVCGQAHQCDISIKRLGHPEVRVESKAHGEQTGEKVRARETMRFQSDLVGLKLSGIFVSLHTSIVGKPDLAIEMLSTGKFAVYLGNNQYDVGVIESMLHLVYRLEGAVAANERTDEDGNGGGVTINPETMQRVQLMLKSCADKVNATKVHLRSALTILTDLTFDMISRTLLGDAVVPSPASHSAQHACTLCPLSYKTATGLVGHMKAKHACTTQSEVQT